MVIWKTCAKQFYITVINGNEIRKKNNNKMSSDVTVRSVPDLKSRYQWQNSNHCMHLQQIQMISDTYRCNSIGPIFCSSVFFCSSFG